MHIAIRQEDARIFKPSSIIYSSKHAGISIIDLEYKELYEMRDQIDILAKGNKFYTIPSSLVTPQLLANDINPTILDTMNLRNTVQVLHDRYNITICGKIAVIGMLDTGVLTSHQEFQIGREQQLGITVKVPIEHEITARSVVDNAPTDDEANHGTAVADSILSIAPRSKLISVKVTRPIQVQGQIIHGADDVDIVKALDLTIDEFIATEKLFAQKGIETPRFWLINMSLGSPDTGNDIVKEAIKGLIMKYPQLLVFASAGNLGPEPSTITSPASAPFVVAVGNTYPDLTIHETSSRGPVFYNNQQFIKPDLCACGTNVRLASSDGSYQTKTGTSFSCPILVGSVALTISSILFGKTLGLEALEAALEQTKDIQSALNYVGPRITVKPVSGLPPKDNNYGYGIPQADLLVQQLGVLDEIIRSATITPNVLNILTPLLGFTMFAGLTMKVFSKLRKA